MLPRPRFFFFSFARRFHVRLSTVADSDTSGHAVAQVRSPPAAAGWRLGHGTASLR